MKTKWINIKDRLPLEEKDVLLTDGENIYIGSMSCYEHLISWQDTTSGIQINAKYWQELPKL